jgi:hypothetical protein
MNQPPVATKRPIASWLASSAAVGVLCWVSCIAMTMLVSPKDTHVLPPSLVPVAPWIALPVPGLLYLAWSYDKHGAHGLWYKLAGVLLGIAIPAGLVIALFGFLGLFIGRVGG